MWVMCFLALAGCTAGDGAGETETGAEAEVPDGDPVFVWPHLKEAAIRPGVRIETAPAALLPTGLRCTTSFVFASPDNASLFIGSTSHCLAGRKMGDALAVADIPDAGVIAYCSYTYVLSRDDCGADATVEDVNDFALIRIEDEHRDEVHPAVWHWGGPTGLGAPPAVGTHVVAYANSSNNPDPALARMEGYVCGSDAATTVLAGVRPGVPGDSGSPLMTGAGRAIGHLMAPNGACAVPARGMWASNLAPLLAYMENEAGLRVELMTWPMLAQGSLP